MHCLRRHYGKFHKSVDALPRHPHNSAPDSAPVAQLDRVPGYEPGGREFESLRAHHLEKKQQALPAVFLCPPSSPAGVVDTVVPVAGKFEATLQSRLPVRGVTTGFCLLAGIGRWPADGSRFASSGPPVSRAIDRRITRRGCGNHRRCCRLGGNLPALFRHAHARHRLVRHRAIIHALEHLLRGHRRNHRQQQDTHASKQCHPRSFHRTGRHDASALRSAPSVKQVALHRVFPRMHGPEYFFSRTACQKKMPPLSFRSSATSGP